MRQVVILAIAGCLLTGCETLPPGNNRTVVETHKAMVDWINPAALVIGEVTDEAKSETEGLDPAMMDKLAWGKLQSAARSLEFSSRRMAEAKTLRVGAHTAEVPGFANRAEIQAKLDANPDWFRQLSAKMAGEARELEAAAVARNLRRTRDLAQNLNQSCQSCHTQYWEKPVT